jgi:hypothetical protein
LKNILTTTTNLPMLTRLFGRVGRMGWFEHFFIHSIGRSVDAWEGIGGGGGGGGGEKIWYTYSRSTTTVGLPFTKERIPAPLYIVRGRGLLFLLLSRNKIDRFNKCVMAWYYNTRTAVYIFIHSHCWIRIVQ